MNAVLSTTRKNILQYLDLTYFDRFLKKKKIFLLRQLFIFDFYPSNSISMVLNCLYGIAYTQNTQRHSLIKTGHVGIMAICSPHLL